MSEKQQKQQKKRHYRQSKEVKAPDKVTQKMTADGAVLENQRTGETENISTRQGEADFTKAPEAKAVRRQSSRLNFTEEERASPELQRYIEKSDKAAEKAYYDLLSELSVFPSIEAYSMISDEE